jgi:hypothetical protein
VRAADRAILGAAWVTVVGLAAVAGAISYSHMELLARTHGESGWRAHTFPLSVDGIEIVASLVLLSHRRRGTPAGRLPWVALAAGTSASVAANVAVAASDLVGRVVAGWPAVALLVAVKLLSGLLDGPAVPAHGSVSPGGDRSPDPGPVSWTASSAPGPARSPDAAVAPAPGPAPSPGRALSPAWSGSMEAEAEAIRVRLMAAGQPITRRALAAELRAAGYGVRNDRLGELLRAMREEPGSVNGGPPLSLDASDGGGGRD